VYFWTKKSDTMKKMVKNVDMNLEVVDL